MTARQTVEELLPKVRDEIRQLQQLEAALVAVLATVPAPATTPVTPLVVAVPAPVQYPDPSTPRPLVISGWTNAERRAAAVQLLRMRGPMRVADLARELEAAQGHVQEDMAVLLKSGHVARVDHGTYASVGVVWSGTDRAPLVDAEAPAFARRSA